MAVLKFGAVNLDARARIAKQRFSDGFNHARFTAAGWTKKKKIAYRAPWRVQPGQKHLIDFYDFFYGRVLANNLAAESSFKVASIAAPASGI